MEIKIVENQNAFYSKQKLLGEGAFGKAYLVKHKQSGENLVIKQMNIEHMSPKEKEETFKQAQILKNLSHPNIVKFKEVYITKNNKLKIVMQYAECGDLAKAIHARKAKKQYFEEQQILDWFTQICLAIKHVHDRKIIHRDIKGQNIFVTKSNTLKLGDFGIARVLNKTMEKARTVVGTPYYLSPEIIQNKPYSFGSDIWSIGAVLYEMCALQPPFVAPSLQMLALKIVKGSYTPIQGKYSADLKSMIGEMLTLNPSRRPSINEILKKQILQDRIRKFLSETKRVQEFSHTILHNQKVEIFANKLVKIQQEKKQKAQYSSKEKTAEQMASERKKLKEDQIKMEIIREQEKKKNQEKIRKMQENKKQQQQERREYDLRRKEQEKKWQEQERRKWIQKEKQRQRQRYNKEREYQQNRRIADMIRRRQEEQQKQYERNMEMQQLLMRKQQIEDRARRDKQDKRKRQKKMQEDRKAQDFQDAARKQYFENLQIRKRAQQRAKRQQESYYSEPAHEEPPQNYHYEKNRPSSRPSSRDKRPNQSDYYNNKNNQPSSEQLQNAYGNPNFNQKKRTSISKQTNNRPSSQQQSRESFNDTKSKDESKKKIEQARDQMRKDRQNFIKNKSKGNIEEPALQDTSQIQDIKDKTKIGKWGKNNSRVNSSEEKSPRFKTDEDTKQDEPRDQSPKKNLESLIMDSEQLFLQPENPAQFNNYIAELEDILNDVQKKIDILPDIPYHEEILFREDDEIQLQLSMTADNPKIKKQEEMDSEDVDLEYFSNFSKLETLRMQLEEAFGLDNFIRLYRYLEAQVNEYGLQNFNIVQAVKQAGGNIDRKVLQKKLTLLLTLVTMQDKINCV